MKQDFQSDVVIRNFGNKQKSNFVVSKTQKDQNRTFLNFEQKVDDNNHHMNQPVVMRPEEKTTKLLPILSYRFNLREIVKQCILLEDHLINKEKQCHDCIIKHFLAMEGLAEEALTLNKELSTTSSMYGLPDEIRKLQKLWYDNKKENSIVVAQKLRKLRKVYMEDSFDIIFHDDPSGEGSCSSSKCRF